MEKPSHVRGGWCGLEDEEGEKRFGGEMLVGGPTLPPIEGLAEAWRGLECEDGEEEKGGSLRDDGDETEKDVNDCGQDHQEYSNVHWDDLWMGEDQIFDSESMKKAATSKHFGGSMSRLKRYEINH